MKIEKGQKYLCIEDVVMDTGVTLYFKGKVYPSEKDNCITDENKDYEHWWVNEDNPSDYFQPLSEANGENTFSAKWGELVEVSDDGEMWTLVIYVAKNPKLNNHIVILEKNHNVTSIVEHVRKIKPIEISMSEALEIIAQAKGINKEQIKIV